VEVTELQTLVVVEAAVAIQALLVQVAQAALAS
jgi:hypothetical protein